MFQSLAILAVALFSFLSFNAAFAAEPPASGEAARVEPASVNLLHPNDVNTGSLLLPARQQGFYVEAPRLETDVAIDIAGPIARVKVTQRFENPAEGWVEGIYVFPLPEESAVDTLKMRVGDRLIEGVIKPREEARRVYEKARKEGRKAALLEQQRDNLFTNNVANIGPGETVIVEIEYQQSVRQSKGEFSLRFPMVVAPRYSPRPIIQSVDFSDGEEGFGLLDPVPDRQAIAAPVLDPRENARINPVTLTVRLAAGFPLGTVESPYHELLSREQDETTRILTLENETIPADRDFVLRWRAGKEAPNAGLFREEVNGETYILAFVTPPEVLVEKLPKKQREAIFVIDNSGSMAGESMDQAKQALAAALQRLTPDDRFNIVRFDDTHEQLFADAVPADGEQVAAALDFVRALEAEGGTEMLPALEMALTDRDPDDRLRQVVFITDGAIGNEQQLFSAIADERGRSRVFTIGIGSAPNSYFMNRAAEIGRGTFTHIGATGEVAERMGDFFEKLENPVMTGLSVQGVGANLSEVSPDPLPDLYNGEPIVLAARAGSATGTLQITGDYAGQPWQVALDLEKAKDGEGIGKLWARRKIASLEAGRAYDSDFASIDRAVEEVALDHHLVSSRTSLVAVDVKVTRPEGEAVARGKLPLNLPAGWDAEKWFGEEAAPPRDAPRKAMLDQRRAAVTELVAAAPSQTGAAAIARAHRQAVTLPQTGTLAGRQMLIGLMLMLFAGLILAVRAMYRHTGASVLTEERQRRRERAMRDFGYRE